MSVEEIFQTMRDLVAEQFAHGSGGGNHGHFL